MLNSRVKSSSGFKYLFGSLVTVTKTSDHSSEFFINCFGVSRRKLFKTRLIHIDAYRCVLMGKQVRVNLTMDGEVVQKAKELGLNLSKTCENALKETIRRLASGEIKDA